MLGLSQVLPQEAKAIATPCFSSGYRKSAITLQKARDACSLVFSLLSAPLVPLTDTWEGGEGNIRTITSVF